MEPKEEYDVDIERTYFELLAKIDRIQRNKRSSLKKFSENIYKIPKSEQIPVLIASVLQEELCEKICKKYKI